MKGPSDLQDRRGFPDRRVFDEGPPPGMVERRLTPERRGMEVEEIEFDERIALQVFAGTAQTPAESTTHRSETRHPIHDKEFP